MDESIKLAVKRAIGAMRDNLGEQFTVDDMARAAMFSKFHFTRIFQRATGVSPGRFLSALRLQQAKHLLVSTSLNVADISLRVGYNSVGTFSSRFSRSVGMSPTAYRRRAGFASHIPAGPEGVIDHPSTARVHGHIWPHSGQPAGLIFVGLFPGRIPEGGPARCAVLTRPGAFQLDTVPPGTWHLLAQSVPSRLDESGSHPDGADLAISVASHGPLVVRPNTVIQADLRFNPAQALDPPVLLALLDARELATVAGRAETAGTTSAMAAAGPPATQVPPSDRTAA